MMNTVMVILLGVSMHALGLQVQTINPHVATNTNATASANTTHVAPFSPVIADKELYTRTASKIDPALYVDGKPVIPFDSDGKFHIDASIKRIYITIGVLNKCDFGPEIMHDDRLLVIGIEANPEMIHNQEFVHERFKLFNFAAGAEDGTTVFHVTKHPGCSSVKTPNSNIKTKQLPKWVKNNCTVGVQDVTVPMRRLDHFFERIPASVPIEWVKTDVQGYDFEVLKSAGKALDRVNKLQYEVQDSNDGDRRNLYEDIPRMEDVNKFVNASGFPYPKCTTANSVQDVIHEYDCVTCRQSDTNCYRKQLMMSQ